MNWNTFKHHLTEHPLLQLEFNYDGSSLAKPGFHITEIKQAQITSVDCGGRLDAWPEIIIQLWEPGSQGQDEPFEVQKALKIIQIVEDKMPLTPSAPVKIEYGNPSFGTRQMPVSDIIAVGNQLQIHVEVDTTQCKANDVCGKPKIKLSELTPAANCCSAESGCC